jgi:hypothetical protein
MSETHLVHSESQLVAIDAAYRQAEKEFDDASQALQEYGKTHFDQRFSVIPGKGIMARVGAWKMDPRRQELERAQGKAMEKRNGLLAERAELLKELGAIR